MCNTISPCFPHQIKENMFATERHHKDTLQQMEHKFFEEKVRLQQEASKKIAELAERAHSEAIRWMMLKLAHVHVLYLYLM